MKKMFLFLLVAGILAAPTITTEAAQNDVVVSEDVSIRRTKDPQREEDRLLREAKRVVREIFKAQRVAKKEERTIANGQIAKLREQLESADKETKKELRTAIADLRENKKYDSIEKFLDNLVLSYGNDSVKSEGYVVSVADTRKNLDAEITYNAQNRTLILTKDGITVNVTLDAVGAYVNGEVLYAKGSHKDSEEAE